ncbi:MAG: FHA domain-containing protein, partial [Polyangia bacterium]
MAPVLEFFGGQREPFQIDRSELYIGRGAGCALRLDGDAADERHARVTMDGAGNVYIQDLDTHSGTLRNGNFVYGQQQLAEGDKIEIGGMALVFRAAAPVMNLAPPASAPVRAGADERTRMPMELPPEVRAVLAARQQQAQAPARPMPPMPSPQQPPPPVEAAPAGIIVGTPEPEPDNFRTVQMAPADLAALGIDPATLPPITKPTARPAAAPPPQQPPVKAAVPAAPPAVAKKTMM